MEVLILRPQDHNLNPKADKPKLRIFLQNSQQVLLKNGHKRKKEETVTNQKKVGDMLPKCNVGSCMHAILGQR